MQAECDKVELRHPQSHEQSTPLLPLSKALLCAGSIGQHRPLCGVSGLLTILEDGLNSGQRPQPSRFTNLHAATGWTRHPSMNMKKASLALGIKRCIFDFIHRPMLNRCEQHPRLWQQQDLSAILDYLCSSCRHGAWNLPASQMFEVAFG